MVVISWQHWQQQQLNSLPNEFVVRTKMTDREFVCGCNNINSVKLYKRLLAFILFLHWSYGRMFLTRFFFLPSFVSAHERRKRETEEKKKQRKRSMRQQQATTKAQNELTNDAGQNEGEKKKMKK